MTIHVQRSDDGFTEIAGNVFNGGSVSLESGRDGEVFVNETWSTLRNLRPNEAVLVCQALGYGSPELTIKDNGAFGHGQGPVIQNLQCDSIARSLLECQPSYCTSCSHKHDVGIICNQFVGPTGIHPNSYLERVSILDSKRGLVVQTPTVRLSNCHINNTEGAGLTIQTDFIELDLNGTVVEHGQSTGIFTETRKGLHIFNGTTQHNLGSGILLSGELVDATVEKMNILNNNLHGIENYYIVKYYTDRKTQISVKQNNFESDTMKGIALKLKLDQYYRNIEVLVEKNIFRINAVSVDVSMIASGYNTKSCVIKHNRFLSSGPITINAQLVSFEGNTARDSSGGENCFLTLDVNNWYSLNQHQVVSVFTNSFNNISGKCVVLLKSSDNEFNGTFNYNQISNSTSKEAAVMLNSKHFNFLGNLFDNPISDYELKVLKTGEEEVKAEHNWWGSTDPYIVNQRILHKDHVKMLLKVDYLPLLTYQKFDCLGVNNCSDKGVCVRPNGCRCDSGWGGADCSDFDCSDVSNCNRNGVCMGPNQCNCSLGWEGATCVLATCHEVHDCGGSQRGYCVLPEKCTCFPDYSGDDCMQCAQSRWGESCLPCPRCNHGSCNVTNGICHCIGENWSGELCDTCTETFYGPACLPYINVLNIIPRSGPDTGGRDVHIWGHNFPETGNNIFLCRFDTIVVNGTRLSKEHIVCKHPQHPAGVISVEISPDGEHFTTNQTQFTYYEVCPPGACGKTDNPPHGHCLYGGCVCLLPWSGRNCSVELKAPIISLSAQTPVVAEGDAFSLQPVLSQGSVPIDWYLSGAPSEMTIDLSNGRILWERAVANVQPLNISVRASNYIGHSEVQLSLTVKLSYNVTIDVLTPSGVLTVPKAIQIKGHVTFFSANRQSSIVFVDVKIRNKDKTKSLLVLTSSTDQGHFETLYYPMAGDSGQFDVDGRHPADTGFSRQTSWSVLGMKCVPGYVNRQAYLDTEVVEMPDITSLKNDGVDPISNISFTVEGAGGPLSSAVVRTGNIASANTSIIAFLNRGEDTSIDLVLTASSPLRGTIAIVFSTPDGTTARVTVGLQLNVRKPFLVLSPTSLSESVPRRTQKTFQINIKNEGEVSAKSLRVAMPSESRLTMSAFSSETTLDSADGLDLQPNETAILILTFTTGAADSLGQFTGSVALNSDLFSASIPFTFYVTSQETLNITVRVEDEYTYFATGKPLVSGAVVTLQNPRRGYRQQRTTTNQTEFVVFEDASEDRYSLTVSAPGHGSYSAVIIAKPSDSSFTIFLQRVAVKYSWTVTPTTFEDKYIVTLESTYETQVPMPVVTVEPAKVNIIPYETGVRNVINFNVTNHGLIRADNVRFILPSHSTLVFTQNIDPIGFLEANTSIIVPVSVTLKTCVKRSSAGCGLKMLYDVFCGGTRTGGQDITLTRELPGRPPLPCRSGGSGTPGNNDGYVIGRGSRGSSITSLGGRTTAHPAITPIEYKPVTPLTCDCLNALIKDCLLPFVPGGSCVGAMLDLGGPKSFFGHIMDIIKLADACTIKPTTVLGTLEQLIKCLYEADKHCPSRRDTDGEVTQGVVKRNTALRNYMVMLEEVFGHENPFDVYDNSWGNSFNLALADDSAGGSSLSSSEIASIVSPLNSTRGQLVERFLLRWNKTMTAWEDGTLASLGQTDDTISYNVIMSRFEQFKTDTQNAKQRGFDSIFEDFDNAVDVFQEKEKQKNGKDDGICAKVRVRIVQELVLTRDAFNARLEIENGEQSSLDNIRVTVNIRATYGDASSTNDKFSVGSPTLNGLTGVDGTGRLETEVSGSAEWLIIPYSTAAVREDTLYDVGGILSYTVDGSNFTIHLLPDTITVKPNPSLTINYFHEKYVQGDDPMTSEVVEPNVPFTLAVMVTNGAYGIARQLKITSAQPEIIENERGLLISFKIIGAQLEKKPVRPSLSIDFGDIESFETKTARWLLTSSLRGKFYNFTATFENINPLGDPQLSIMEHVGYHELVHLVRLESTKDVRDDFLVNDVIDEDELPEVVYDSSNGFVSATVLPTTVKTFSLEMTMTVGTRSYSFVNLSVIFGNMSDTNYTYTRLVNNETRDSVNETLLEVTRHDGKSILVGPNAWQTSHYHDKFYLHIFDHHRNIPETASASYSLVFGPKNIHKPMFKQDGYQIFVYSGEQPGPILKVQAVDEDRDTVLRYMLMESSLFAIHQQSGQIRSLEPLQTGLYNLSVAVTDDGVPAFNASVHVLVEVGVNITVTSDRTLGTTPTTFSPGDRIMPSVSTEWLILPSINGPMDSPFSTEKATVSFSPSQKQQFLSNSIKASTLSLVSINGSKSLSSPIERSTSSEGQIFAPASFITPKPSMLSTEWGASRPIPTKESTFSLVSNEWLSLSSMSLPERPTSTSNAVPTSFSSGWQTVLPVSIDEPVLTDWQASSSVSTEGLAASLVFDERSTSFEEQTFPSNSIEGSMTSLFSKEGSRTQVPVSSIISTLGLISSSVMPKESISLGPSSSTLSSQPTPGTTSGSRRNTCINFIYMQVMFVSLYSLVYSYAMCIILC
ncbi:uncharacterized protein LOC124134850 [Haliotis rufescens]|uniref:uncharacterized protein LOC124134850 n=1 Tax=Haliotis rufescens TaxID=6454 RepID=UPI00201E962C|nr:uncharacterized protein LOC124134850 [Haliotis rufescens]